MSTAVIPNRARRNSPSVFSTWGILGWLLCVTLLLSDRWLLGPSLFVLLVGLYLLSRDDGPPVVAAAFTYQWLQVTVALWYLAVTSRRIDDLNDPEPTRMVLIGLATIVAFFGGYYWVNRIRGKRDVGAQRSGSRAAPFSLIAISYVAAIVVNFPLQRIAWSLPAITQILVILSFARYCLLYVLMTRLLKPKPKWSLILLIVAAEIVLGFTGYFATFKESLVFVVLAIFASANRRSVATWMAGAAVVAMTFGAAVVWTAIKPLLRAQYSYSASPGERLLSVVEVLGPALKNASTLWEPQVDRFVSRLWMIKYPALAIERVPSAVPHENGKLLWGAVSNTFMPRMFFPEKGVLPSSSDKVRKYSGVYVAGRETRTSCAFGYAAESYVDFGWPWMLVPIFTFGAMVGLADWVMRSMLRNSDIRDGVRVVVLWSSMYAFEVSWVFLIGLTFGLFTVLVGGAVMFERTFLPSYRNIKPSPRPPEGRWRRREPAFPSPMRDPNSSARALPRGSQP